MDRGMSRRSNLIQREEAMAEIIIEMMEFKPNPAPIKAGESVVWHNKDGMDHTATADDGSFDTGIIPPGRKSEPQVIKKTTPYHCTEHPGMKGVVQVG
jgi:plastocyanin